MSDNYPMPNVISKLIDPNNNCTYIFYAYRPLTKAEQILEVKTWLASNRRKKPPKNKIIELHTMHGFDD